MLSVNELEDRLIDLAFAEDIGDGDHTTLCCIPETAMGKSHLQSRRTASLPEWKWQSAYSHASTLR